jgi:DNA (cytosine-5)-methyltransferase 1
MHNDLAHTLKAEGHDASEDGTGRGVPLVAETLTANGDAHSGFRDEKGLIPVVAFNMHKSGNEGSSLGVSQERTDCLRAFEKSPFAVMPQMSAVRRLTPCECERLQGFPDDYTFVPHRNKPAADGPRYKALGNSMAVPVMRWIGERIAQVDEITNR